MVAGAFAGWMAVYSGTGLWIGVCVAMLVGMLFGLVHSTLRCRSACPSMLWALALHCLQRHPRITRIGWRYQK